MSVVKPGEFTGSPCWALVEWFIGSSLVACKRRRVLEAPSFGEGLLFPPTSPQNLIVLFAASTYGPAEDLACEYSTWPVLESSYRTVMTSLSVLCSPSVNTVRLKGKLICIENKYSALFLATSSVLAYTQLTQGP